MEKFDKDIKVLAWNLADGLSYEDRAKGIVEAVTSQKPTAAVFPEAWQEGEEKFLEYSLEEFEHAGYEITKVLYDDSEHRSDRHGLLGIVRAEAVRGKDSGAVRMAGRNAIFLAIVDQVREENTDIYGVHFNDRNEESRVEQATALIDHIGNDNRVMVGGDYNASHRTDNLGRALRIVRPLFKSVPVIDYRPGIKPSKIHHMADKLRRASQMAIGTTIAQIEAARFEDADPDHRPTAGPLNIDHWFVRDIKIYGYQVLPQTDFSDHRAITATLL